MISNGGAPNLAFSVDPKGDQRFNPLVKTAGRWPNGPNEIAIDTKTANEKHFAIGDTIGVLTRGPVERFRIVGLVKFGGLTLARRRDARDLRPPHRAAHLPQGGQARLDRHRLALRT